jgi:hypothetical protein
MLVGVLDEILPLSSRLKVSSIFKLVLLFPSGEMSVFDHEKAAHGVGELPTRPKASGGRI